MTARPRRAGNAGGSAAGKRISPTREIFSTTRTDRLVLIGWLRWRGTPDDQRKVGPPQVPKGEEGREAEKELINRLARRASGQAGWPPQAPAVRLATPA
jgi:hypothetical protein